MFLTNTQVSKFGKVFANNTSADKKVSKTLLHKIVQSGGFLGSLLGPLLKPGLPLIGNVLKPLPKRVLMPLRLIAAESAADAAIHQKMFAFGRVVKVSDRTRPSDLALRTLLMISNEEMNDVMKIIKSFEESGLLIKGFNRTIKSEAKEKKRGFLSMLLGTLDATLLGDLLTGKGTISAVEGTIRAGENTARQARNQKFFRTGKVS